MRLVIFGMVLVGCAGRLAQRSSDPSSCPDRALASRHSASDGRLLQGVEQICARWTAADGDPASLVEEQFISDPARLDATFDRLEAELEQLDGHFLEIGRELKKPSELDLGPLLPIDPLLSAFDPAAHLGEDFFRSKIAFAVLLNFPVPTPEQQRAAWPKWDRRQWAQYRLVERFEARVPAEVEQAAAKSAAEADLYIAQYNLWMHHVLSEQGARLFPKGMKLISHWNLREEIRSAYRDPQGSEKQRVLLKVIERIVDQSIPLCAIDDPRVDWNPFTNQVTAAPPPEVEQSRDSPLALSGSPEPDRRYEHLLAQFHALARADPYWSAAKTAISRSFDRERQIPEDKVTALLTQVLDSTLSKEVASRIERRLGRRLLPQDLWYDGLRASPRLPESQLDEMTKKRYPTAAAFSQDIPRILKVLGFSPVRADYLASRIVVDPARGAGHALPAARRGDFPHLRTRIEKDGMNYKGFNIAIHELGHNVEQVFSLYDVDHTLLAGVPNNAFTEALAFVFQARDLDVLGIPNPDPAQEAERALDAFWQTWEISGVALLDIRAWHWMYDHPHASPAELKQAVVEAAKELWNRYYQPVLGGRDELLLGIYSHMIAYPLYLSDYPLGHLIAFQIERHLSSHRPLGSEFERMARIGRIGPDAWMVQATGSPIQAEPLLSAAAEALKSFPPSGG